ncbi:MAG: GntR family transcriptional regulator [Proteobacteria bacterium]|nr:GntR family transcriptional regulator [Pseudomonadota bacterium]
MNKRTVIDTGDARPVDRAYEGIRRRILEGALRPGDHLGEEQLAEFTGTSRTPVREALRRLAGEGLVIIGSNGRSYVTEFDPVEVEAVFEIRARLESYAAELACERITEQDLNRLAKIADEIDKLGPEASAKSVPQFLELNAAFHQIILEAAGSRQLSIALSSAAAIPLALLKHYVWAAQVNLTRSNEQHRQILAALRARNPFWAGPLMTAHINSTRPPRTKQNTMIPETPSRPVT